MICDSRSKVKNAVGAGHLVCAANGGVYSTCEGLTPGGKIL